MAKKPTARGRKGKSREGGVPLTWDEVTILLTQAQRPKSAMTEAGADRRRRAAAVEELIALLRPPDKNPDEKPDKNPDKRIQERDARRILHFLRNEGLRILLADDPFKALRLFLGRPGRGHREKPEWQDHNIAVAVEKRVARGLTVERAVEQVAETRQPHLGVHHIRKIYYRHRQAAKADLDLRRREKG
jgi:hypothetical protein